MNTRALAAQVVTEVFIQGASLTDVLAEHHKLLSNKKDQALLQELCFGVVRWWWRFDAVLTHMMEKPFKPKDSDLKHLAMVGLYQLADLRIPDHAAIAETVNACGDLKKLWAKKLLNALLRNYQRKSESITGELRDDPLYQYSHPQWLLELLRKAWPEHWQQIIDANNKKPPMVLRVNQLKQSREQYKEALAVVGSTASEFPFCESGLILEKPLPVEQLPGFDKGWVSVQDGAAQLAAGLLNLGDATRVLDVCAAPGGKAAHILESSPSLAQLTALDIDRQRLNKVAEAMSRLGVSASLVAGDAQCPQEWWDNQLYDRILLDAPCSATGVIRRHPDIKQLRRPSDIPRLVALQAHILNAVWPLLGSGGMLLYATCSILPEENDLQVTNFLESHSDASTVTIDNKRGSYGWGIAQRFGRQILPGQDDMDGFYYACLQKH